MSLLCIQFVCHNGLLDQSKVSLKRLNTEFGLPEGTIDDTGDKLHPTIPTTHVANCEKPSGFISSLPHEKQAILVAALSVMQHAHTAQLNKNYQIDPNAPRGSGVRRFGDENWRGLPSYKSL